MKNALLLEKQALKQVMAPADLAVAVTGARIGISKGDKIAIAIVMGASLASTTAFTLKQHDAATAGNSKNLEVANPYFYKAGSATAFTKVSPTVAAAVYDLSTIFSTAAGIVVFEVLSEQLDNENGYGYVSVDIGAAGAAKIGAGVYILDNVRHAPAYALDI